MAGVDFDITDVEKHAPLFIQLMQKAGDKALLDVANEVLRLSSFEVPLDTGNLQGSGSVQQDNDGVLVGYNTVYAARLHENPQYNFKNGRKGRYLADPVQKNILVLSRYYMEKLAQAAKAYGSSN